MKCFYCDAAKVPCVYETPTVWEIIVRPDIDSAAQYSRSFTSIGKAMEFVNGLANGTLIRIFEKDLFSGTIKELP